MSNNKIIFGELHRLMLNDNYECFVNLIEAENYDINYKSQLNFNRTIISNTCEYLYKHRFINFLIERGADVNLMDGAGAYPLSKSIYRGGEDSLSNIDVIKSILTAGANLLVFDDCGRPPLQAGIYVNKVDIVSEILRAGADPYQDNEWGRNSFALCEELRSSRMLKFIEGFFDKE
jgi:ankyrin repeat protein